MELQTEKSRPAFRIDFAGKEWKAPFPGSRYKAYRSGNRLVRIAEFTPEFTEADWCEKAHIGYVIEGSMQIDCHGRIETLKAGDGMFIPAGEGTGHKVHALTPVVRLLLVEEI
jgi:quercetin dioxygenase-like cupin family protein